VRGDNGHRQRFAAGCAECFAPWGKPCRISAAFAVASWGGVGGVGEGRVWCSALGCAGLETDRTRAWVAHGASHRGATYKYAINMQMARVGGVERGRWRMRVAEVAFPAVTPRVAGKRVYFLPSLRCPDERCGAWCRFGWLRASSAANSLHAQSLQRHLQREDA